MALISAGKSNGILDASCCLSSLFLSRIVKWSFWLVTKLNATENHGGIRAGVPRRRCCAKPSVFTLMGLWGPQNITWHQDTVSLLREKRSFHPHTLSLPITSSPVLVKMGFWLSMSSLAKIQACWKTCTKISKDRLYYLFLTHKSSGSMPASQTKYFAVVQ